MTLPVTYQKNRLVRPHIPEYTSQIATNSVLVQVV